MKNDHNWIWRTGPVGGFQIRKTKWFSEVPLTEIAKELSAQLAMANQLYCFRAKSGQCLSEDVQDGLRAAVAARAGVDYFRNLTIFVQPTRPGSSPVAG